MARKRRRARVSAVVGVFAALAAGLAQPALAQVGHNNAGPDAGSDRQASWSGMDLFDELIRTIEDNHFDVNAIAPDWAQRVAQARIKAKSARNEQELREKVLGPFVNALPGSHWAFVPADGSWWETSADMPIAQMRPGDRFEARAPTGDLAWFGGADLLFDGRRFVVHDVMPGGPAAKAGIEIGDVIDAWRWQEDADGETFSLAVRTVRAGRSRSFGFAYPAGSGISQPAFSGEVLTNGALLIRFNEFSAETLARAMGLLTLHHGRDLVLDLRYNHGGLVAAGTIFGGVLTGPGRLFMTLEGRDGAREQAKSFNSKHWQGCRMAVLVGPMSASAAELVADFARVEAGALIVGGRTSGRVRASLDFTLSDGSIVQVPTDLAIARSGALLEGVGVVPDVLAENTAADRRVGRDAVLEAALAALAERPCSGSG